jgi:hypothetical protein
MNGRGAPLCIVVFVAFAVCLPAIRNSFVDLDDVTYVEKKPISDGLTANGIVFAASSLSPYWHPLTWLSHELDAELFGASPGGHHLTSVILHGLTAALLCLVLIQLGATTWQAAGGALLWALHPLRVESFAWVAERKDVLCALFFVAAIAAYLPLRGLALRRCPGADVEAHGSNPSFSLVAAGCLANASEGPTLAHYHRENAAGRDDRCGLGANRDRAAARWRNQAYS